MASAKQHKLSARMRRTVGMIVATCMIAIASLFASAGSASAAEGKCKGALWGQLTQDVCILLDSGQKDALTHSQYINGVTGSGDGTSTFMDMWGDGFYYSWQGTKAHRDVHRWLRSGTNVCVREIDHEGQAEIVCMAIKA